MQDVIMNVLNECKTTSAVAISGVVLAGVVYSYAAYESLNGRYPGAYAPLAMLAPIFLLSNNYKLLMSVFNSILPSTSSKIFFCLALLGGALFQAACAGRYDLKIIVALAACNLMAYIFIAIKQHKLDHKSLVIQCKSQQALSDVLDQALDKKTGNM